MYVHTEQNMEWREKYRRDCSVTVLYGECFLTFLSFLNKCILWHIKQRESWQG